MGGGVHSSKQGWAQALLARPPHGGEWECQTERLLRAALSALSHCPLSQASPRHLAGSLLCPGLCSSVPILLDGSAWCTDISPARPGGEMGALLPGWVLPGTSCKPRKLARERGNVASPTARALARESTGLRVPGGALAGELAHRSLKQQPGRCKETQQVRRSPHPSPGTHTPRAEAYSCGNPNFLAGGS